MQNVFTAHPSGLIRVIDKPVRLPIHNVPAGRESDFNRATEGRADTVLLLLEVFKAHNVEVDPRNRGVLISNLLEMNITGERLARAIRAAADHAAFAERVYARDPALAEEVSRISGAVTFARDRIFGAKES